MSSLVDTLATFGTWNWLFAAAILMGLEFIVPGVHFIWFGLAAALTGLAIFALAALGAGDAVTANLTAAFAAGATLREALELAMAAASIVIHQLGTTGTARVEDLRARLFSN